MGERCSDNTQLSDYGISEPFIKQVAACAEHSHLGSVQPRSELRWPQVAGFVVNPQVPGQQFVKGKLRPIP